jgi:hypothetical protein
MNDKLKSNWIAALRSGKYKQTAGTLKKGDSYCCLGVLCEIDPEVTFHNQIPFMGDDKIGVADLLQSARDHYGLDREVMFDGKAVQLHDKLTELNDTRRYNFDQIASYLEKVKF